MASIINNSDKLSLENVMVDLANTFERNILLFQTATRTVISTNPSNNIFFDTSPTNPINDRTEEVVVSGIFPARILYDTKQPWQQMQSFRSSQESNQPNLQLSEGMVRIKVASGVAQYLVNTKRIQMDGSEFEVRSDARPHGLFTAQYFNFYLKRLN